MQYLVMVVTMVPLKLFLLCFSISAAAANKKGIIHTVQTYMCGDFDVLNDFDWWLDYWHTLVSWRIQDSCLDSIDTYQDVNTSYVPMFLNAKWGIPYLDAPTDYAMGFNEPNHIKQANIEPDTAATIWPTVRDMANASTLVSPAPAPCGQDCITNTVEEWLDVFFNITNQQEGGCCQYLAVHTYVCDPLKVMDVIVHLNDRYNKTVWLTEFVCSEESDPFIIRLYMQVMLPKLDAADIVFRYAWFQARRGNDKFVHSASSLLEPNSPTLTGIGQIYNDYQGGFIPVDDIDAHDFGETPTALKNLTGVFKKEIMVVLKAYVNSPTEWYIILNAITWNIKFLAGSAKAFYITSEKPQRKARIKDFFGTVMCASEASINDTAISVEVTRIWDITPSGNNKGKLKLPSCN